MAYNEELADKVRKSFGKQQGLAELNMFGGLCFTVNGHMAAGVVDDKLMLRVGPDQHEKVLAMKHAEPMTFTGKPMKGMVYVAPEGCKTATQIKPWLKRALTFVEALPPKPKKKTKK